MPSSYAVSDLIERVFGEKMLLERGTACYAGSLSLCASPFCPPAGRTRTQLSPPQHPWDSPWPETMNPSGNR